MLDILHRYEIESNKTTQLENEIYDRKEELERWLADFWQEQLKRPVTVEISNEYGISRGRIEYSIDEVCVIHGYSDLIDTLPRTIEHLAQRMHTS